MKVNELENKFIIGEFINIEKETYNERYDKLIKELSAGGGVKKNELVIFDTSCNKNGW